MRISLVKWRVYDGVISMNPCSSMSRISRILPFRLLSGLSVLRRVGRWFDPPQPQSKYVQLRPCYRGVWRVVMNQNVWLRPRWAPLLGRCNFGRVSGWCSNLFHCGFYATIQKAAWFVVCHQLHVVENLPSHVCCKDKSGGFQKQLRHYVTAVGISEAIGNYDIVDIFGQGLFSEAVRELHSQEKQSTLRRYADNVYTLKWPAHFHASTILYPELIRAPDWDFWL